MNVRVRGRRRRSERRGDGGDPSARRVHDDPRRGRAAGHADDRLLEAERGEQAGSVEDLGEGDGRSLEFGGEVSRVHRVDAARVEPEGVPNRSVVCGGREYRHVRGDDAERSPVRGPSLRRGVPRRLAHVDVERDDLAAPVGERPSDRRAPSDADFDQALVRVERADERPLRWRWWSHGAAFMTAAVKSDFMLVDIVPVGEVTPRVKREASGALRSVYDCDVTVHDDQPIPDTAFDADRDQYRAEDLIETVTRVGGGEKNIGITPEDLYYRRRNYVFGLAYLNGSGSVISTHRLRTSSDGGVSTKPAIDVFGDRVRKEVVHEIGHTLGLEHCDNSKCVMSFSPTVREVDVKEENLCGTCSRLVR